MDKQTPLERFDSLKDCFTCGKLIRRKSRTGEGFVYFCKDNGKILLLPKYPHTNCKRYIDIFIGDDNG